MFLEAEASSILSSNVQADRGYNDSLRPRRRELRAVATSRFTTPHIYLYSTLRASLQPLFWGCCYRWPLVSNYKVKAGRLLGHHKKDFFAIFQIQKGRIVFRSLNISTTRDWHSSQTTPVFVFMSWCIVLARWIVIKVTNPIFTNIFAIY